MPKKSHVVLLVIAFLVTAVFVGIFAKGVASEWDTFVSSFKQCDWLFLVPAVALVGVVFAVKAVRWRIILWPVAQCRLWPLFSAASIGFMANCILPARAGEVIRVAVLGRSVKVRKTTLFATVVVERIFDILGLVVVTFLGLGWLALRQGARAEGAWKLQVTAVVAGLIAATAVGFLILLRYKPHWARNLAMLTVFWLPEGPKDKVGHILDGFIEGLAVVRGLGQAAALFGISILHWTLMGVITQVTSLCFLSQTFVPSPGAAPMEFRLGLGGAFIVLAVQSIMVSAPQAPGFLGVHQTATSTGSQIVLGPASQGIANAYAVVLWCVMIIPVIALGMFCLWREGLSLGQMRHMADAEDQPEGAPLDSNSAETTSSEDA